MSQGHWLFSCFRHSRLLISSISHPHLAVWIKTPLSVNSQWERLALPRLSAHMAPREAWCFSLLFTDQQHLWEKPGRQPVTDWWMMWHLCSSLHRPFFPHPLTLAAWGETGMWSLMYIKLKVKLSSKPCISMWGKACLNGGWLSAHLTAWWQAQERREVQTRWVTSRSDRTQGRICIEMSKRPLKITHEKKRENYSSHGHPNHRL